MGRTYLFWCGNCRYEAKVAGGPSEGLEFTAQTILCSECGQLQDAVTAARLVLLCYKRFGPQKGQHGSCRIKAEAMLMRRVAIDCAL